MYLNFISVRGGGDSSFMEAQLRHLIDSGLHWKNPFNGVVSGFDVTGERVELADEVGNADMRERVSGVQLWFDDASDVYVSWEVAGVLEVHVDGLDGAQMTHVAAAVSAAVVEVCLREQRHFNVVFERR